MEATRRRDSFGVVKAMLLLADGKDSWIQGLNA
jgi:hypothetical protein